MLTFKYSFFLILLLFEPLFIYLNIFSKKRGDLIEFSFSIWGKKKGVEVKNYYSKIFNIISLTAFYLGFTLLILAMSKPYIVIKKDVLLKNGMNIMITLDVSPSMGTKDFSNKQNRLDISKQNIRKFIKSRKNDAIGIVTFGSDSLLYCPPTTDYKYLLKKLDSIEIFSLGQATNISLGLGNSLYHINSSKGKKIIILMTDGISNYSDISIDTIVNIAKKMQVKIYAIGIGSKKEGFFYATDKKTGKSYSGISHGAFDENFLKNLANRSGGLYFPSYNIKSLNNIFDFIDSSESNESFVKKEKEIKYLYIHFIIYGLFFIIASILLDSFVLKKVFL